jgi:hypothetical protein
VPKWIVAVTNRRTDMYAACRGCGWSHRLRAGNASMIYREADGHARLGAGHQVDVMVQLYDTRTARPRDE